MGRKPIKLSTSNVLYQKAPECAYPIEESDWKRIKGLAEGIKCPKKVYRSLCDVCWGIVGSAFLQWIYCCCNSGWAKWCEGNALFMIIACVGFGIFGFFFYLLDREKKTSMEDVVKNIVKEMNNLETRYSLPEDKSAIEVMSQKIENAQ